MSGPPEYPNLNAAFKSAPIVTTLLAAISAALLGPAFAADFRTVDVAPWGDTWTSRTAVLIAGVLATIAFVLATLSMIYAEAKDIDALEPQRLSKVFADIPTADREKKIETYTEGYRKAATGWYETGRRGLLAGVSLLALTAGFLVWGYTTGLSVALGVAAAIPPLGLLRGKLSLTTILAGFLLLAAIAFVADAVNALL